jgi:hypothetical protein
MVILGVASCSHRGSTVDTVPTPSGRPPTAPAAPPSSPSPAASTGGRSAHSIAGNPRVGALFFPHFYPGLHTCTASVVHSPHHNVIMTAAHCPNPGPGKGYSFVPAYHGRTTPYGVWKTTAGYAAKSWIAKDGNPDRDFAFFTVAPRMIGGKLRQIEDVVGANRLGRHATNGERVRITGHPLGIGGKPITCVTHVYFHAEYPASHCAGFQAGTSGGPWVAGSGRRATVVGLISGFHQGGCTPARVYSTPLGRPARAVLRRAERHRHPDTFGNRPSDGCSAPNL